MNPLCPSFDTDSCLVKMGYRSLNNLLFDSVHQWRYKSCAFFQLVDYRSRRKRNVEHPSDCLVKMIRTHSIHAQVYKKGAEILSVLYIGIPAFRKFSPVHSAMFCTAVHSEDLMFNNICFYDYINRVSFFGWHTDCTLAFLEQGTFFASGRIMGNCPVNFLWD